MFEKGTIVTINNQVGVVVLTGEDLGGDLEDHTAVWFGPSESEIPEVWTIPTDYLSRGPQPVLKH
ncbi:hypothetical protein V5E97_12070 [Singulisphaera sp. Ch08]|uniref:DUF2158 domain-containing protein n=1 Tax=Singulisphaera sp. Ch08 TaxID=3120278 RepID=A0AAU7CP00_9BACT